MRSAMQTVIISPKYQIVIPKEIREALNLVSGEKLHIFTYQNRLEIMPVRNIKKMRGFLKGMDTVIEREKDRI